MARKIRKAGGAKQRKYPVRPYKKPDLSKGPTPPIAPKEFREEPLDTGQKYLLVPEVGLTTVGRRVDLPGQKFVDMTYASPSRKDTELRRRDRENRMSPTQRTDRRKKEQKEREREAAARAKQAKWVADRADKKKSEALRKREAEQEVEERNRAFREKMKGRKQ